MSRTYKLCKNINGKRGMTLLEDSKVISEKFYLSIFTRGAY